MGYVPEDIEVRRNALALHKAMREAQEAAESVAEADLPPEGEAEEKAARDAYYAARKAAEEKYDAEVIAINQKYLGDSSKPALDAAASAARSAYYDAEGAGLLEDGDGDAVLCAASGAPIYDTDEIVEDPETGETFLRAALGLPARPADEVYEEAA